MFSDWMDFVDGLKGYAARQQETRRRQEAAQAAKRVMAWIESGGEISREDEKMLSDCGVCWS